MLLLLVQVSKPVKNKRTCHYTMSFLLCLPPIHERIVESITLVCLYLVTAMIQSLKLSGVQILYSCSSPPISLAC